MTGTGSKNLCPAGSTAVVSLPMLTVFSFPFTFYMTQLPGNR